MILAVVAVLSMTMTANAAGETAMEAALAEAYDMRTNISRLSTYLGLNVDQAEAVEYIHDTFCREMRKAARANAENREAMMKKAVEKDLKYMHSSLNEEQYRKYLTVLNATMYNHGLVK